jgi:hypothetical protein
MKIGKALCRLGVHRWQRVRLLTRITPFSTTEYGYGVEFTFRVNDAKTVTECARCRARRRMEDT